MLYKTGVPTKELVKKRFPDSIVKPKAIIECYEEIPCNPCSTSCPFGAISIGEDINKTPELDVNKCTGCAVCVYSCPGLAIMVAQDLGEKIRFKIPYEMLPAPVVGEVWDAVNREGKVIGRAVIERVTNGNAQDRTQLVQLVVGKELQYEFVSIRRTYE